MMCMKSFLDTDRTTESLWSYFAFSNMEYTHKPADMSPASQSSCCYADFTSATKRERQNGRAEKC